jgi:hypothetical protein
MPEPYADTLAKFAAGRTALVERLRALAARIEALPLDAAAEVLVLLEPALECSASAGRARARTRARWRPLTRGPLLATALDPARGDAPRRGCESVGGS